MTSGNVQYGSGGWRIFLTRSGVLLFLAAAASSAYLTRHCIAVANTAIQRDLDISEEQMGLVLAVFSAGYFLFQIPGGWLGNRLGARTAFPLISALWSLVTVVSAAAMSLFPLLALRAAFGAAQAGLVPISAKVIGDWFPVQSRGLCSAVIGAAMSVGGVVAMGLTAYLMNSYGWRDIFRMYSIVGIVWAVAFYVFFRATPAEHPWLQTKKARDGDDSPNAVNGGVAPNDAIGNPEPKELTQRELLVRIVTNRSIWAINAQSFFRAAGYGLFVTWFSAFLEYRFGVLASKAGALAMYPLACVIVGSLLGGVLVDLILKRTGNSWLSRSGVAFLSLGLCGVLTFFATVRWEHSSCRSFWDT